MHASLPRGQTLGITVVLSGRGFLTTFEGEPTSPTQPKRHAGGTQAGPPIPVKLQLLNTKQGGYSIRILRNDDRQSRAPPVVNEEISEISVLNQTAQEFDFVLNRDGSRHAMTFSNLRDGQQFQAIFTAVKTQEQRKMTSSAKRGMAAMAARFPGMPKLLGGGGGSAPTEKLEQKTEQSRLQVAADPETAGELDVHTLVECLKAAIEAGDENTVGSFAKSLATLKPKLSILVETSGGPPPRNEEISVQVQVEDRHASKLKLRMTVPANITIAGLKKMTFLNYDLPVQIQNWIIKGKIMKDNESLVSNGITSSGATLYLYLTSAEKMTISKQDVEIEKHALIEKSKNPRRKGARDVHSGQWPPSADGQWRRTLADRVIPPSQVEPPTSRQTSPPSMASPGRVSSEGSALALGSELQWSSEPVVVEPPPPRPAERKTALEVGWKCPQCTLDNPPLIPGCQACMMERPETYRIPEKGSYVLDPSENLYLQGMEENERALKEMEEQRQAQNYQDLLQIEGQDLVQNREPFECTVCLLEIEPGEGVVLRECLHTFCKECLGEHVRQSTDAMVKCPSMDNDVACVAPILEREIKALLTPDDYQKFLERSLRRAESTAANSFHCKTADCRGFCFYEDDNNFFMCPLCRHINCLTCKAIHEGINCKQYQEDLRIRAHNDVAAKQTQDALQMLVQTGEAMRCPHCSIIVQKKGGCDWLRCSVCQTEICWVTKQARWGSKGTGDISGGCRCRVNGVKCHPNCHNCH